MAGEKASVHLPGRMELYTKAPGKRTSVREKDIINGEMAMSTKASGKTIWQKEKECCVLKMVQYTPAISLKEKRMEREYLSPRTVHVLKETLRMV